MPGHPDPSPTPNTWLDQAGLCLAVVALGLAGMLTAAPGRIEAPLWPAAGLLVVAVWQRGRRVLPGLLAGSILVSWLVPGLCDLIRGGRFTASGVGLAGAVLDGGCNVLAALVAGLLLRGRDGPVRLDRVGNAIRLWTACATYAAISAAFGATLIAALTPAGFSAWQQIALTWATGDLVGALVMAPLLALVANRSHGRIRPGETLVVGATLALSIVVGLFGADRPEAAPLEFVVFPPLLWAALRLPPLSAAIGVAAVAAAAFAAAATGLGPFAGYADRLGHLLGLQAFIAAAAVATHLVVVVTAERRAAMEALAASEERFRLISENAHDLICLHGLDGRFTYVSPSARRLLGWDPEELIARTPFDWIHPDDVEPVRAMLREAVSSGGPATAIYRIARRDGSVATLEATATAVHDRQGRPAGVQASSHDISARVARERELAQARTAAETASRAKAAFLAAMSHEIRTPLNGVIGMAEAIVGDSSDPRACEAAATIRRSGETLLAILNDILDFSKIEAGRLTLDPLPVDPLSAANDVRSLFARLAAEKGLTLEVESAPDVPRLVVTDPARLRQVLSNLVSNAVKFTRRGGITILVRRNPADAAAPFGRLDWTVMDTGIGIPDDARDRLFTEFSQVDIGTARRFGGTGLGLAISRRLAEAMGGRITYESEPGKGSSFTVSLPMHDPELTPPSARGPRRNQVDAEPPHGLHILLAEDDAVNQVVASALLRRFDARVEIAPDGAAALIAWQQGGFDLVLMDMQMPGMDGLEATRAIRGAEAARGLPRTPIVALTANAFPEDRAACLAAGMDEVVAKPVTLAALGAALTRARPLSPR